MLLPVFYDNKFHETDNICFEFHEMKYFTKFTKCCVFCDFVPSLFTLLLDSYIGNCVFCVIVATEAAMSLLALCTTVVITCCVVTERCGINVFLYSFTVLCCH